jgi:hypothetical protein
MRELQMWCPAPLPEGEIQRRKLRSDKYKPPAGRLLENYESDSSVEADKDTDAEAGADPATGAAKSQRKTRSTVAKKSASAVATMISAVKAAEQKKRKRGAASPPSIATPTIPTPHSREVGLEDEAEEEEKEKDEAVEELPVPEDQASRRPESPAAKRQWELVQKTLEEALRRGLEARRSAALRRRGRRYLRLLSLGCFGRRLGFRLCRGINFRADAIFILYYLNSILMKYFAVQAGGKTTRGARCPIISLPHEVA